MRLLAIKREVPGTLSLEAIAITVIQCRYGHRLIFAHDDARYLIRLSGRDCTSDDMASRSLSHLYLKFNNQCRNKESERIPCIQLAIKYLFFFIENMLISPRESDAQLMSTFIICNEMFSITFLIQPCRLSNNWVVATQDSTSCSVSVVPAAMASSSALLPFPCK